MEALGINLGYLIVQILGIIFLLLILTGFVYKPMLRVLDERKARIAKGLEDARQAEIARQNADADAKRILDEARAEAANLRREAVVAAEGAAKDVEHKAREDARAIMANAQTEATEFRDAHTVEVATVDEAIEAGATGFARVDHLVVVPLDPFLPVGPP